MTLPLLQLVEEEEVNMMKVCQSSTKVYWTYLFLATAQQVTLSLTPSLNKCVSITFGKGKQPKKIFF